MTDPLRIMTVCTGNICRSPMAEVVLRARLEDAGIAVVVDSTGTTGWEAGEPMDARARRALTAAGYTDPAISTHRARQVRAADLAARDLVLAATADHARALRRLADDDGDHVTLLRSFDPALQGGGSRRELDLDDPWYGGYHDFERCLEQIESATDGLVERLLAGRSDPVADSR